MYIEAENLWLNILRKLSYEMESSHSHTHSSHGNKYFLLCWKFINSKVRNMKHAIHIFEIVILLLGHARISSFFHLLSWDESRSYHFSTYYIAAWYIRSWGKRFWIRYSVTIHRLRQWINSSDSHFFYHFCFCFNIKIFRSSYDLEKFQTQQKDRFLQI